MIGITLTAVGALAEKVPGSADEIEAPAWLFGLLAFGALVLLLFVVTRFNRDR